MKSTHINPTPIITMYKEGQSVTNISSKLGLSSYCIYKVLQSSGAMSYKPLSKLKNYKLFPMDTFKAWMLGVLYGDGHLHRNGCQIVFTTSDRDILEQIQSNLNTDYKIRNIASNCLQLAICSTSLHRDLTTILKLESNKSKTMIYPEPLIDSVYELDFIRGYLDSDGCWSSRRLTAYGCSKSFMYTLASRLNKLLDISLNVHMRDLQSKNPNWNNQYGFSFQGKILKTFIFRLYNLGGPYCMRKKEQAFSILNA
jgi:hypothetical protein